MRYIRDIYREQAAAGRPVISFEFFPPKTEEGERVFMEKTIPALQQLSPDYCSVTYGAGGSTQEKTLQIVDRIQRECQLVTMAHLTCVNSTRAKLDQVITSIRDLGVKNILALRGDPPNGGPFVKAEDGFEFSYELVERLRARREFSVGVAGFPEGHIACQEGKTVDWDRLIHKIQCGADFVLTQLFFSNRDFFEFRDYLARRGVTVPIVPGIISILSAGQIKRFTQLCGAKIPPGLAADLDRLSQDDEAAARFGIDFAARQCEELLREGAPGIHFYTLNKAHATTAILRRLGLAKVA